jgi:site-specific DNA recombinase
VAAYWLTEVADENEVKHLRVKIEAELRGFSARAEQEADRVRTRLHSVRRDRLKWAEKAMSGVVPDDIARDKQAELARQVEWCEEELQRLEVDEGQIEALLEATLLLATRCHLGYQSTDQHGRRLWNQAWFESIEIDVDDDEVGVSEAFREPVPAALQTDLALIRSQSPLSQNVKSRPHRAALGSNVQHVVHQSGRSSNRWRGSNLALLVEAMGLEPTTPCLQSRCSSQLSYAPEKDQPTAPHAGPPSRG